MRLPVRLTNLVRKGGKNSVSPSSRRGPGSLRKTRAGNKEKEKGPA